MWDLIVSVPDHCLYFYFSFEHLPLNTEEHMHIQGKITLYPIDPMDVGRSISVVS